MPELNYHHLHIFLTVARLGNFTRAAERLFISQPSISAQVKDLERFFGLPLVERHGRGFRLTEAGERVYAYAERIFALEEDLKREVEELGRLRSGHLLLGASTTVGEYVLPEVLGVYRERFPGIELQTSIGNSAQVAARVVAGDLRLGIIGEAAEHPDLEGQAFTEDTIVLFAAPSHPLAGRPISPDELNDTPMIAREPGSATRRMAEAALARSGVRLSVAMEMGSNEAVKRAVAANLGIGALSRLAIAPELAAGRLTLLDAPWFDCRRPLFLIQRRGRHLSAAEQAFVRLLTES